MQIKKHLILKAYESRLLKYFNNVPDWRQKNKTSISIVDAMMSGLACMYFQDPSLLQFQKRLQEEQHKNNLKQLFGIEQIPKETQMREIIDNV